MRFTSIFNFSAKRKPSSAPKRGQPDPDLTEFLDTYSATILEAHKANLRGDEAVIGIVRGEIARGIKPYASRVFDSIAYKGETDYGRTSRLKKAEDTYTADLRSEHLQKMVDTIVSQDFFNKVFHVWPSNDPVYEVPKASRQVMHSTIQDVAYNTARRLLGEVGSSLADLSTDNKEEAGTRPDQVSQRQQAAEQEYTESNLGFKGTTIGGFVEAFAEDERKIGGWDVDSAAAKILQRITTRFKEDSTEWQALREKGIADSAALEGEIRKYLNIAKIYEP